MTQTNTATVVSKTLEASLSKAWDFTPVLQLPVGKTALTATRPKWPGQTSGSVQGGGREGGKRHCKGVWTAPPLPLVVRLEQNLEMRNSMCCFPKYTHSHACKQTRADSAMAEWPLLLLLLVNLLSGHESLFATCYTLITVCKQLRRRFGCEYWLQKKWLSEAVWGEILAKKKNNWPLPKK